MNTREDSLLAWHHTRLVEHVVSRVGASLLLGAFVALLVGAVAWQAQNTGWVFAAPGLGVMVMGAVILLGSTPAPPE